MIKNNSYYQELIENYEEAAFKLFIYEKAVEDTEKTKAEEMPAEVAAHAEMALPRMLNQLRRIVNRREAKVFLKKQLPKLMKIAAALVLVAYMGLTVAIAASGDVRRRVVEFLIQQNDGYNSAGYFETGVEVEVPAEWTANYYPSYIPEGFRLRQLLCDEFNCYAEYINDDS